MRPVSAECLVQQGNSCPIPHPSSPMRGQLFPSEGELGRPRPWQISTGCITKHRASGRNCDAPALSIPLFTGLQLGPRKLLRSKSWDLLETWENQTAIALVRYLAVAVSCGCTANKCPVSLAHVSPCPPMGRTGHAPFSNTLLTLDGYGCRLPPPQSNPI